MLEKSETPIVNEEKSVNENNNLDESTQATSTSKRNSLLLKITLGLILIAIVSILYWLFYIHGTESSDDAYVGGNLVYISPRVSGTVIAFYADDTDFVKQGQLLVQLDPADNQLAYERAQQNLALAVRQVFQLKAEIKLRQGKVMSAKARYDKSLYDYQNRQGLQTSLAISPEEFEHAGIEVKANKGTLQQAESELQEKEIELGKGPLVQHPNIAKAKVAAREAFIALKRTSVIAPVTGYVAKRKVQVGENASPTKAMMAIIPVNQIWGEVNFKETQLEDIRIGQSVKVTADIYGRNFVYNCKVLGISPGTGSVFSLLPPQNATGNWIKIVQRVPVRIAFEPEQLKEAPLWLGLSLYATVNTTDQSGELLTTFQRTQKIEETSAEYIPMEEVDVQINKIIREESRGWE